MNLNKIHLIGRITAQPELKQLPSGTKVVKFGLATNHSYKDKEGKKVESTQFHNCVAFARLAEVIGQYVVRGQEIYIGGRVEYRTWEKKEGGKGFATEIMVEDMQMGQKPKGAAQSDEQPGAPVDFGSAPAEEIPTVNIDDEIKAEDLPF